MTPAIHEPDVDDEDLHMGSEYTSARTYLARRGGVVARPAAIPAHGSNDSDFCGPGTLEE